MYNTRHVMIIILYIYTYSMAEMVIRHMAQEQEHANPGSYSYVNNLQCSVRGSIHYYSSYMHT